MQLIIKRTTTVFSYSAEIYIDPKASNIYILYNKELMYGGVNVTFSLHEQKDVNRSKCIIPLGSTISGIYVSYEQLAQV